MSSVDVIIPCYRYGHYLRECVESVLSQAGVSARALVIDDASPDDSAEVGTALAAEDSRVTFVRHDANRGHIATYNEGLAWTTADYTLLLSADDYLLPGSLGRAAALMDANPEVGFTFGWAVEREGDITRKQAKEIPVDETVGWRIMSGAEFIASCGSDNCVRTPTAVVRTSLHRHVGGYLPELPHSGDLEIWLRLAAHAPVGLVSDYQAVYRRHPANMSSAYFVDGWLPDLKQRKAALDCFAVTCRAVMPNARGVLKNLYWSLGRRAVHAASGVFDEGRLDLSAEIAAFALDACPEIRRSAAWMKYRCKRTMGPAAWSVLRPTVAKMRRLKVI